MGDGPGPPGGPEMPSEGLSKGTEGRGTSSVSTEVLTLETEGHGAGTWFLAGKGVKGALGGSTALPAPWFRPAEARWTSDEQTWERAACRLSPCGTPRPLLPPHGSSDTHLLSPVAKTLSPRGPPGFPG